MARGNDSQIHVPRCHSGQHYSLGIQSPCQMMIGVYNHLRNARYLGSMKPFSEGDWIPRDSLFFKNFQSHSCGCSKVKKVDRRYIIPCFFHFLLILRKSFVFRNQLRMSRKCQETHALNLSTDAPKSPNFILFSWIRTCFAF